jgi:hemerythrin
MDYTISVILDGLSSVNNRQAIIDRLYDQLSSIDQLVTGERFSTLLSILSSNNQISIPSIVNRSDFSRYLVDVAIPLNQQTDFDDKLEMDILRVLSTIDHLSSHESIMALVRQDSLIRCVMRQQADIRRQQSTEQYLRQLLNAVAIESITNHIQLDEHRNRTTKLIKQLQIVHNQLKSLSQLMNRLQSIGSVVDTFLMNHVLSVDLVVIRQLYLLVVVYEQKVMQMIRAE